MRLIGIGLLAFLLAGVALFLTNSETLRLGVRTLSEVTLGPRLAFEAKSPAPSTHAHTASVHRAGPSVPLILSGLPAYQSAAFYIPIDARPTSGYLQIDATVQALAGVEGVLRVSIGNTKRAELLLRPGEAGRSLRIQLTDQDIAREQLVVSFSLQGEGPHTSCAIDEGFEAIVEIETTSAVFLELDRPLDSARDHALAQGRRVTVTWSNVGQADALLAGRKLNLTGIEPSFSPNGTPVAQALEVADAFSTFDTRPRFAWSDALSPNGSFFGLRRFYRSHTWRLRYDMSDAQDARLPDSFTLNMMLGQQAHSVRWHVVVTLNGKLLYDGFEQPGALALNLPLPSHDQRRSNVIEVTLASTQDTPGHCNQGPELVAEVLKSTILTPGQTSFDDPILELMLALKDGWQLDSEGLSPAEATIAVQILSELPEPDQARGTGVVLRPLARGTDLGDFLGTAKHALVVFFDDDGVLTAVPATAFPRRMTSRVSVLVDLTGAGS